MKFSLPIVAAIGITLAATVVLYSIRANSDEMPATATTSGSALNMDTRWEAARQALEQAGLSHLLTAFDKSKDPGISFSLDTLQFVDVSADALQQSAEARSSDSLMTESADRWYYNATMAKDSTEAMTYAEKASSVYKKALELRADNHKAKTGLARCYVFFYNQPMQGVQLLKQVEETHPDYTPAIAILADMSVTSGQLDKAAQRYEQLTRLSPENPTYHIRLAEIFENLGEKQKAILSLQSAKKLISDERTQQQIDNYINELKR